MRKWKRFLGLGKLSAMAAIVLASCSDWGQDMNQEFQHQGIVNPAGTSWQYSESGNGTVNPKRALIEIKDVCSEISDHEKEHIVSEDSVSFVGLNPRSYLLKLDLYTADSVLVKAFMPDYRSNMTTAEWNKFIGNLNRSQQVHVIFNTKWSEHHIDNPSCRRLKPEDIVRVYHEIGR